MARETQGSPANEKRLEQYGVWVKVKPREVLETSADQDTLDLSDLESAAPAARSRPATGSGAAVGSAVQSTLTADEEQLLDDLELEMGPGESSSPIAVPEEEPLLEEAELPEIETAAEKLEPADQLLEEELPELDEEPVAPARGARPAAVADAEVEVTLSDDSAKEDHFDDLAALESELATTASSAREAAGSSASSAQILARIEEELKSIRSDLTQLRGELSGLRIKAAEQPAADATARGGGQGGFFDEDEDETIALTGDELDNILNTAEVTEEAADVSAAEGESLGLVDVPTTSEEVTLSEEIPATEEISLAEDLPPAEELPKDDILSYETPVLADEELVADNAPAASAASDDTLVLTDDALLPGTDEAETPVEELPSELVLEDLGTQEADASSEATEVELETLPELESEPVPSPAPVTPASSAMDDLGDETIDLETLDLGEEPKVIDAVPEQVEDLETVEEAEAVPDDETLELAPLETADEIKTDDVDLEALAAEAEELEDTPVKDAHHNDLEIGELESVSEELEPAPQASEEIEIPFEAEAPTPSPEADAELEQILDAEEVPEETPAKGGAQAPAASAASAKTDEIPDNLKEEIRTVLKYMDNLLEALPDEKIQEFARSDYFVMYKKLFEDLGLGE